MERLTVVARPGQQGVCVGILRKPRGSSLVSPAGSGESVIRESGPFGRLPGPLGPGSSGTSAPGPTCLREGDWSPHPLPSLHRACDLQRVLAGPPASRPLTLTSEQRSRPPDAPRGGRRERGRPGSLKLLLQGPREAGGFCQ